MTDETVFHAIVRGDIPADRVYETETVLGFRDIHPKAPTHILFVAKRDEDFVPSINDLSESTAHVPGMLILAAQEFAKQKGITGYRLTFHVGKDGGQEVMYLHLHFLSQQAVVIRDS